MEIKPSLINGAVVLDVHEICTADTNVCRVCPEQAVGIHNWLMSTGMRYVIIDFQDEKEICKSILIELLQLRKRLKIPFIFVGLMERPKSVLMSYAYSGYPIFSAPEEAVMHLKKMHGDILGAGDMTSISFEQPIPCSRSRHQRNHDASGDEQDYDQDSDQDDQDEAEENSY